MEFLERLLENWQPKIIISFGAWIVARLFHLNLHLLIVFALMEAADCLTKWLSLTHNMLTEDGEENPTLFQCLKAIAEAHRRKIIQSGEMRGRFCQKMEEYLLVILLATLADYALGLRAQQDIAVTLVVTYITATELLSCLENLNDAGVSMAGKLCGLIKSKFTFLKGEDKNG